MQFKLSASKVRKSMRKYFQCWVQHRNPSTTKLECIPNGFKVVVKPTGREIKTTKMQVGAFVINFILHPDKLRVVVELRRKLLLFIKLNLVIFLCFLCKESI